MPGARSGHPRPALCSEAQARADPQQADGRADEARHHARRADHQHPAPPRHRYTGLGPTPKYGLACLAPIITAEKLRPSARNISPRKRPPYLSQPWLLTSMAEPAGASEAAKSRAAGPVGVASSGALIP